MGGDGDHVGLSAVHVGQSAVGAVCRALLAVTVPALCRDFVESGTGTVLPAHCRRVIDARQGGADVGGSTRG